jgi:hypothetical protein
MRHDLLWTRASRYSRTKLNSQVEVFPAAVLNRRVVLQCIHHLNQNTRSRAVLSLRNSRLHCRFAMEADRLLRIFAATDKNQDGGLDEVRCRRSARAY